ncbi:MAG: GspH/FimT family pseudopilin [Thiohalocapsa sp.]|jgi:type IV fimbrial biogenesis protein FimT
MKPQAVPTPDRSRQHGVTLVELMVTLSVVAILLLLGVPQLGRMAGNNARASEVNAMIGNLNFARAQAITLGRDVDVCPVDPANVEGGCSGGATDWHNGYAVIDENGRVLRFDPGPRRMKLRSGHPTITFKPDGSITSQFGTNIKFCDRQDSTASDPRGDDLIAPRRIAISRVGRVRVSEKESDGSPIDCTFTI